MPFDNLPYADLSEKLGFVPANHSHAQLYGAELRPIFDERGEPIPDHQRIVRSDTGKTLEVVGKSYSFIDNRVIFGAFEEAIAASGLDSRDMIVGTDYSGPNLTRVFRQYVFPAHREEIRPGVEVALRIAMFNSFDRSAAFSGRAGLYTFVCANTCLIGKDVGNFSLRHTGDLDTEAAIKGLVEAADGHAKAAHRLRHWPQIPVSDAQAREVICAMEKASDKQIDRLVHSWVRAKDSEGPQGGPNLWTLSAVLSAWSTHGDHADGAMAGGTAKKDSLSAAIRAQREAQVARLIECEEWKELEEAGA
jgi:hypothetical protein